MAASIQRVMLLSRSSPAAGRGMGRAVARELRARGYRLALMSPSGRITLLSSCCFQPRGDYKQSGIDAELGRKGLENHPETKQNTRVRKRGALVVSQVGRGDQ